MAKNNKPAAEEASAPETQSDGSPAAVGSANGAQAKNTADDTTDDVDLAEENSVLRALVAEQAKQLAAHEKISSEVLAQVQGRTARVIAGCIHKGVKYSKQELAADGKVCAELVAMKSDLIQFIN